MELTHEFEVPVSEDDAFAVLTDIERIAPCMPGATLDEVDDGTFTGRVKVKVGPMQMTYRGTAEFTERDPDGHRAVMVARGQEQRGGGTAQATVTSTLEAVADGRTKVTVHTDLVLTGKPAQFGRGVIADVGDKLLGQFADCLAEELSGQNEPEPTPAPEEAGPAEAGEGAWRPPTREEPMPGRPAPGTPIDLLEVAGGSVARRLAPVIGVVAAAILLYWWLRAR